jgi:hypothetical protein
MKNIKKFKLARTNRPYKRLACIRCHERGAAPSRRALGPGRSPGGRSSLRAIAAFLLCGRCERN